VKKINVGQEKETVTQMLIVWKVCCVEQETVPHLEVLFGMSMTIVATNPKILQAALNLDIIGLEALSLSIKLIQTQLNNARKCVLRTMIVIGLHGKINQTQKVAGCYQIKETLKTKTMVETKELLDPKVVLFSDVLSVEPQEMEPLKVHVIVNLSAMLTELANQKSHPQHEAITEKYQTQSRTSAYTYNDLKIMKKS